MDLLQAPHSDGIATSRRDRFYRRSRSAHRRDARHSIRYRIPADRFLIAERVRAGHELDGVRRFATAIESLLTTDARPHASGPVWNLAGVCFVESLVLQRDEDVIDAEYEVKDNK